MSDHPEEIATIQRISMGRSREVLELVYKVYMNQEVASNGTRTATLGGNAGLETNELNKL